jgi:tetratricopeptide (TPR) repeat protein
MDNQKSERANGQTPQVVGMRRNCQEIADQAPPTLNGEVRSWCRTTRRTCLKQEHLLVMPAVIVLLMAGACSRNPHYYFDKATQLAAEGKPDDAVLMYRKAIQGDGNFGEAHFQLGVLLWRNRKMQEAYVELSHAVDLLPRRDDAKAKLADLEFSSYLADERHPKALFDKVTNLCDQLLAANPQSYDGLRLKAHLAAASRRYKDAEELYSQADKVKSLQPELVLGWTEVLLEDNQVKEAEQHVFQLIAKEKTYGPIYDLLYKYYAAVKRLPDAENILRMKVANNPSDPASALELAAFYAADSRENEMKAVMQRLLDDPKTFPDARLQVGDLYAKLQRWDDALHQYDAGTRVDSKRRIAYLRKIADVWLAQGKGEEASQVMDEILQRLPHDPSARGVKASLLIAVGKPDDVEKAAKELKSLVDESPKNFVWHFNLGRALAAKGDLEGARVQFQEAVNLQRSSLPPRLALLELAQARHDYKSSVYYADEILALHPDMLSVKLARAVGLMYSGRDQEALADFAVMERHFPNDPEVHIQVAVMELRERKFKQAEDSFRKLMAQSKGVNHGDDTRAINGLIETLTAENQPDKAISVLQDELKNSPDSIPIRSLLAKTAALEAKYDLAIEQYRQLLARAPNSGAVCLSLGIAYRMKGDFANAIPLLEKARALAPKDPVPMIRLGGVFALTGRRPEAIALYRDALKLKPDDAATWSNAAYLIAETGGNLDEATKFAQQAIQLNSGQPGYTDTLGWIYFRKRLNDSAIQIFRRLTQKYPGDATFHYHLGLALLQQGDREAARAELKTALAGKPSDEVRHDIETALGNISRG